MRKKHYVHILLTALLAFLLSGCLTCEKKEYVFELTGVNKGKLTIKYINIFSAQADSLSALEKDYDELINVWLRDKKLDDDYPKAKNLKKKLYELDGQLCGEVTMEFDDIRQVRLFQYQDGPYMINTGTLTDDGETYLQSNGDFGGDYMPVVFYPPGTKTIRLTTQIAKPDITCVSMIDFWDEAGKPKK
jgi:hypothetical protein